MADPVTAPDRVPRLGALARRPLAGPVDFVIQSNRLEMAHQTRAIEAAPVVALTDLEVTQIKAFLHALTGRSAQTRPVGRPERVPSGLSVD